MLTASPTPATPFASQKQPIGSTPSASTTDTAMHLAVEVRSGGIHGEPLQEVLHCVAVYTAVDADEQPRAIDKWSPETPGDMALAQRVKAHIDAARAAQ